MSLSALVFSALAAAQTLPAPDLANVVYGNAGGVALKLDVYYPNPRPAGALPLVVWIHGGGWRSGSKLDARPALKLLPAGYAVASFDYRLSQQAKWPAQIHDCKGAVRYLRANAASLGIDTGKIVAFGSSAGGHLASMLGTSGGIAALEGTVGGNPGFSSRVKAVADFYGPADLPTMGGSHDNAASAEGELLGCAIPGCLDKAREASPQTHVTADDAPFSLHHGTADGTVNYSQSVNFDAALRAAGVPSKLWTYHGSGHGGPAFTSDSAIARVAEFFAEALKPPPSGPGGTFTVTGNPEDAVNGAAWTYKETAADAAYDMTGRLWKPAGAGPFPAVIIQHGSGGSSEGYSKRIAQVMVKWGYACFAPNYTHADLKAVPCGSPGLCVESEFAASPANIKRALKGLELLKALPYVDGGAVMAFGHSRGAYVTTALAASTTGLRAAAHSAGGVIPDHAQGTAARHAHARAIAIPYLMSHGDADQTVPIAYDQAMDGILTTTGVVHRLDAYPGYTHSSIQFDAGMLGKVRQWFDANRSAPSSPEPYPADPSPTGILSLAAGDQGLSLRHALPAGMPGLLTLADVSGRVLARYPVRGEGTVVWRDAARKEGAKGLLAVSLRCGNQVVSRLAPVP